MNHFKGRLAVLALVAGLAMPVAQAASWVEESNEYSNQVMELQAKYGPEGAAGLGVEGFDAEIFDLKPRVFERNQADIEKLIARLEKEQRKVKDSKVKQDLTILVKSLKDQYHTGELNQNLMLPYFNLSRALFFGFQGLLDPRIDKSRYPAAIERLAKYTGKTRGYKPITELAKDRISERFDVDGLHGPYRPEVEQDLENVERMNAGIKQVFEGSGLEGWEESYELLTSQLNDYADWVRAEILPRSRDSHLLPAEIYADNLKNFGVDMDPRELIQRATFGYMEIRNEMQAIAYRIAEQRGWESSDYRDVMRKLKEDQIEVDKVLDLYRERLKILEDIIRREDIVSLPDRDAVIRLATEAEAAAIPAPFMSPPPLIGNTGQHGEFVLVASNPNAPAGAKMDDFTHDSITWTLTVHEARPGHEMQFSAMIENGVSTARGVFAFNSANVEGWALYAEAIMKEYLPLEGQLFSLHGRLMRAARAFLDPMLNLGELEPEQVQEFLMDEIVLSAPMAQSEANRYAFLAPGQATSYYYGFMNLQSMRTKAELALRDKFNQREYHDFILAQGFLPPKLLEQVIMEEFVKPRL